MKNIDEKKSCLDGSTKENGSNQGGLRSGFSNGSRSTLEKALLVVVMLLLLLLVAVVVVLIVAKTSTQTPTDSSDVCLTKGCVSAAARIDSYIDYSVPYCDDFYQFSCGNWLKRNAIPDDKSGLDTFTLLRDQVKIVLKNLLEEADSPSDLGSVKKAKDLYRSCMNMDLINSRGDQPLRDVLTDEFGGWPLTTRGWTEGSFDVVLTMLKLSSYGIRPIFNMYVGTDQGNSSRSVLKIDQTTFSMPGQKYLLVARNDTMLMAHEELIFQFGKLLGFADPDTARQEVADIVNFEISLANISVPDEDRRDSVALYNPMTLAEVHGNYSAVFDWRMFVVSLLAKPEIGLDHIPDGETIINQSPLYYQRLSQLLPVTPKRTVANYLIWRFVRSIVSSLGDSYKVPMVVYKKAIFGISMEPARFTTCVLGTTNSLGLAVGRLFIKDNFDADSRTIALEMIGELQSAFNELLDEVEWMDEDTKKVAMEKNERISSKIGYPNEVMNNTYLEHLYSNVTYTKEQYFENHLMMMRESFYKNARLLREVVDKNKWESPPPTVNAFYSSLKNQIMFPAGILQPPFFSKSFPKSLNHGAIGVIIGHEVTHGFDDRGRQFDSNGNLVQWWSQSAVDKFKAKARCIIQQYGNFTVPEVNLKMNGINTQGENIADNGGIKQAFKAYRNWVAKQGKEEPKLPGLDFTANQLFFINFAQMWCSLMTEESALNRIKTGAHSPGRFRVIGSVQNSPDFAKAFNCPANSPMNPRTKCSVW